MKIQNISSRLSAVRNRRKAKYHRIQALKVFEIATLKLIKTFEKKHGYEFTGFVADDPTGIAVFIEEYFFSIGDIYIDIKKNAPKNAIFEWQNHLVENDLNFNFQNYLMGFRG